MQWLSLLALLCSVPGLHGLIQEREVHVLEVRQARGPARQPPKSNPRPGRPGRPVRPIAELPDSTGPGAPDSPDDALGSTFRGTSNVGDNAILYKNFDKAQSPYFLKVYDFFAAEPSYLPETNAYAQATGNQQPFRDQPRPTGDPIRVRETVNDPNGGAKATVTRFNPGNAVNVCGAWTSLISYCGTENDDCPCSSGAYYVPDQYNSLASGCASLIAKSTSCPSADEPLAPDDYWCSLHSVARTETDYCPTTGAGITTARFGHFANPASDVSAEATSAASNNDDDDDDDSMEGTDFDTTYTQPGRTVAPVTTHAFESSLFSSLPENTHTSGDSIPAETSAETSVTTTSAASSSTVSDTQGSGAGRTVAVSSQRGVYWSAAAVGLMGLGVLLV